MDHQIPRRELLHPQAGSLARARAAQQAAEASAPEYRQENRSDQRIQQGLMGEYLRTLNRHRRFILLCALGGFLGALLLGLRTRPVYQTRTSLDIRSLNSDFMDMRSVAQTGGNSSEEVGTNLQTQIRLLESESLMQQVTDRLNHAPHPATVPQNDLLSRLGRAVHLGGQSSIPYSALVDDAAHHVKVKPLGLTRLVEVTCESWDPKFSAAFCNTLTQTFEQQDQVTRTDEAGKTQVWLTRQVADIRQRAEDSQRKLEAAVGGNGLMLSQTTTSAGEERLRQLQDELVKAQADRIQKQAAAEVARGSSPDTLPDVQDNPAHRAYELKLADLRSKLTQLVPTYTEQNQKVIRLRAEIADAERGLEATATSSTGRQNNEYAAAKHREDLLTVTYNAQAAQVSSDLQKAAQVSLLRKEVDSEQALYLSLLQKAKEAGFASAMQAATIRVIDPAKVPLFAASPRRSLEGGFGLALGGLFGIGLSFYRERNNQVFRVPGDGPRFLQVQELGVIPAARLAARGRYARSPGLSLQAGSSKLGAGKLAAGTLGTGTPGAGAKRSQEHLYGAAINETRWNDNFSLTAEAYRNTTLSILLADASKRTRSYVVSSPNVGEGKTTVTSNLGVALSKSKLRVVLIDGDLRRPKLHTAFALENTFGLRNILRGEVDLQSVPTEVLTHRTALPKVALIPAGEAQGEEDVVELLHSSHFSVLLARLADEFDVILIDSPPILHMADARILAGQSDGAILVFRSGKTSRDQAGSACDLLEHDGVRLVGTILNDFDPAAEGKPNYYASYYRYGQGSQVGAGA